MTGTAQVRLKAVCPIGMQIVFISPVVFPAGFQKKVAAEFIIKIKFALAQPSVFHVQISKPDPAEIILKNVQLIDRRLRVE